MPGPTPEQARAAIERLSTQNARDSMGRNIATYKGANAHHLISVNTIVKDGVLRTDDITKLVAFTEVWGEFRFHGAGSNGLILPGTTTDGKTAIQSQPNVAYHTSHSGGYDTTVRSTIAGGIENNAALRDFIQSIDIEQLKATGRIAGYSDNQLRAFASQGDGLLNDTVAKLRYGLTAARLPVSVVNSIDDLVDARVVVVSASDPQLKAWATKLNMSPVDLKNQLDTRVAAVGFNDVAPQYRKLAELTGAAPYYAGTDFADTNLTAAFGKGGSFFEELVDVANSGTDVQSQSARHALTMASTIDALSDTLPQGLAATPKSTMSGRLLRGLNYAGIVAQPEAFVVEAGIEHLAAASASRLGATAQLAGRIAGAAVILAHLGVAAAAVANGHARLSNPFVTAIDGLPTLDPIDYGRKLLTGQTGRERPIMVSLTQGDGWVYLDDVGDIVVVARRRGDGSLDLSATEIYGILSSGTVGTLAERLGTLSGQRFGAGGGVGGGTISSLSSAIREAQARAGGTPLVIYELDGALHFGVGVPRNLAANGGRLIGRFDASKPGVVEMFGPGEGGAASVVADDKLTVIRREGQPALIRRRENPEAMTFGDAGGVLGAILGNSLAGGDRLTGIVASAALRTLGTNLGEMLDLTTSSIGLEGQMDTVLAGVAPELLANLKSAGVGAISSYLTAELVQALGVGGFAGELANTAGGTLIQQVIGNLGQANPFAGINVAASLSNAVGSFLGTKLASEIVSFDTVGGQLGAAVGSGLASVAIGSAIATATSLNALAASLIVPAGMGSATLAVTGVGSFFSTAGPLSALGGPVGIAAAAFVGFIVGGLIGSVFGGTPRSGADVVWHPEDGTFGVANGYTRKGGSKDAAVAMATGVADMFNAVLAMTGGRLASPEEITTGNYGMRKSDFVYRPTSTRDQDAITRRFKGKDGAQRLIAHGVYEGLTDADFQLIGGDVYAKRALYNSVGSTVTDADFDVNSILGNIATAQRYATYLQNSASINALIAAEPDSVFTAEWAITLARSVELGLTRRHESDWYGGFGSLLQEAGATPAEVSFGFDYDPLSNRISRLTGIGDFILGDAIDSAGQDEITGTAGNDIIHLSGGQLLAASGATNAGLTVDGVAFDGQARTIEVAATIDAGDGHDTVRASDRGDNVFGGAGSDTLVGGRLDDWLLGGDGDDRLFAGSVATTAFAEDDAALTEAALAADGGSGNHLDGGAGDDRLYGSKGSDWLVGGDGVDRLYGGAGGDVLNAGRGNEGGASPATTPDGPTPTPTLAGGSFEAPEIGNGYVYNPSVAGTVFASNAGVAGNGSAWGFAAAPDGDQVAFVQSNWSGVGSITQAVTGLQAGRTYRLEFKAAQRPGFGVNPIKVRFDGVDLGTYTPNSSGFVDFTTTTFQASGVNGTIEFIGSTSTGDSATGLDAVTLVPVETSAIIASASFEAPEIGSGYVYNPSISGIQFLSNAGVAGNGSAWGFAAAPDGDQVAFIQSRWSDVGSITQTVTGLQAGRSYRLEFKAARRPGFGVNPIKVRVDGVDLGTYTPDSTGFVDFTTTTFQASGSTGAIEFIGSVSTGDSATGLDAVRLVPVATGAVMTSASFEAPEIGTGYVYNPTAIAGTVFASNAGVAGNGSAWGFAAAPDGDQVAFVQSQGSQIGSITQSITGLQAGQTYRLEFKAAQRSGFGVNPITVRYNGVTLQTFTPQTADFTQFATTFQASGASGTIEFIGSYSPGDAATGIDSIQIVSADGGGVSAFSAIQGGGGSDQYIFSRGDGQDVYFDDADGGLPGATTDSIAAAVKARSAGSLAKNWAGGGEFTVDGSTKGGDDAIAFGAGISMRDLILERSGSATQPGMDLIIRIQTPDGSWDPATGDQIIVKDWFDSTRRIEWLRFADGEDFRIGDFTSIQKGTAGADVIIGTGGRDFQYGGDGDDDMWGLGGDDWQVGGKGRDSVRGNDDHDMVLGGDDDDIVLGGVGNDTVFGDAVNDRVYGGQGSDLIVGGLGDDEVAGGAGDDVFRFQRGDGRDTLYDEFAGTWELVWQGGSYVNGYTSDVNGRVFKGGNVHNDGTTWIGRYDYNELGGPKSLYRLVEPSGGPANRNAGLDTLEFGVGIDIQDVVFRQDGNDLRIAVTRSGGAMDRFDDVADQIRIKDWFAGSDAGKSIEKFQFVNTGEQFVSAMTLMGGSDGVDDLRAAAGASAWITGGGGDDAITGADRADVLNGGSGNDWVSAGLGSDVLFGSDGDDVLIGGADADILVGGAGLDTASYQGANGVTVFLDPAQGAGSGEAAGDSFDSIENLTGSSGVDALYGDAGDNVLDGDAGNDGLYGGAGNDTYEFNLASGIDTVVDRVMNGTGAVAGEAGDDTVELGQGMSLSNLIFVRNGGDLAIQYLHSAGTKLVLKDFYSTPDARIENLVFADGLSANLAGIRLAGEASSEAADLIIGQGGADTLNGAGGSDVISGGGGNDVLSGQDGDDVLEGGSGGDVLDGGWDSVSAGVAAGALGGDTIRYAASGAGVSVNLATRGLSGGDAAGDVVVADGNGISTIENVTGSGKDDQLTGDQRANILVGLDGADTLDGGAGDDVLVGGDGADVLLGGDGDDNIDAGDGNDVSVEGGAGRDLIAGGGGNDVLRGGSGADALDGGAGDDLLWGGGDADVLGGGDGADTLHGEGGHDKLAGGAGDDSLIGGDGDDILSGDTGSDMLQGGIGSDVYAFDADAGADTIMDSSGTNRILISGVTKDRIWLTRSGSDLNVGVIGGTTRIRVSNYFSAENRTQVREIATSDGSLFLRYAGPLIDAMSVASVAVPADTTTLPPAVTTAQAGLWWASGKAAPQISDFSVATGEDVPASGTLAAIDHDENITSYSVADQAANGMASIDPATGAWIYTPNADFAGTDGFTLAVTDADGQIGRAVVTVAVTSTNDAPEFGTIPVLEVNENATAGTIVATLPATDAEGDAIAFAIDGVNNPFAINGAGVLSVRDGAMLNHEAASTAAVSVRIGDGSKSRVREFSVSVRNVAERPDAPTVIGTSVGMVSEPVAGAPAIAGTQVATFSATDPDGPAPTLRLRSGPSGVFAISGGSLAFAPAFAPDFEVLAVQPGAVLVDRDGDGLYEVELSAEVESYDGALASSGAARLTVGVEDTNEAPVDIRFLSPIVTERDHPALNAALTAVSLGLLEGVDPDLAAAGERLVYATSDPRFEIVNGNELRLRQNQALDYESALVEAGTDKRYVDVSVTVSDRAGGAGSKSLMQAKRVYVGDAIDYHHGSAAADTLTGAAGVDHMYGNDGDDTLFGLAGADILQGGNGRDTLYGGSGSDTYSGGEGDDWIEDDGENASDFAEGGAGGDWILLGGGNDHARGDAGDDRLRGQSGDDLLEGGEGADWHYGGDGVDTIRGGEGDDALNGGMGADRLEGGAGLDKADYTLLDWGTLDLVGVTADLDSPGTNTGAATGDTYVDIEGIYGSYGNDVLRGRNAGMDYLDGGDGADNISGRGGDDTLLGLAGDDTLGGDAGNDRLLGGDGRDLLDGGADNDVLEGGAGDDTLRGGAGYDRLVGGAGNDLLVGGAGNDTYQIARGDGHDRIDQAGAVSGDRDLLGFVGGLTNRNLWFEWLGGDVKVTVLGATGVDNSVTLLGYQANGRSNVESVIAADQQLKTKDLAIGLLATTMDRFTAAVGYRPTTQAQFDALYGNTTAKVDGLTFQQQWDNFWSANEAPTLEILNAAGWNTGWTEDQFNNTGFTIQVKLADDQGQAPNLGFEVYEVASEGSKAPDQQLFASLAITRPVDEAGLGSISVKTRPNASGTRYLWIRTTDAGGLASERWVPVTVGAVSDAPNVSRADSPGGNAGSLIPVVVDAAVTDAEARMNGAESIVVIGVRNLPSELSFNKGWRRSDGVWILSHAELAGLHVYAPPGWSQDLIGAGALVFQVWSGEPTGEPAAMTSRSVEVRINGAPGTPTLTASAINENLPAGTVVGQLVVNDPDRLENNPVNLDASNYWMAEARWLDATPGPLGGSVRALQTGQFDTENGGGMHSNAFTIDPSKAYKFTVYVRPDSSADTLAYMGLRATAWDPSVEPAMVENAISGQNENNPYFMHPTIGSLAVGQWYRFEGYVLPQGTANVQAGGYGGIFNVATGQKVADANVYRWNDTLPSTTAWMRYFNYYGSPQGFSTSWYQPVVEELPAFMLTAGSNVSVDAAGVVRLNVSANYENQSTYDFSATATDRGGLQSTISSAVNINNVNEAPYLISGTGGSFLTETGLGGRPANAHAIVATIGVTDPDGNVPLLEFAPGGNPHNWFYIDQATKQVRFRPDQNFNYEVFRDNPGIGKADYDKNGVIEAHIADVWVRASDGSLISNDGLVQVFIEDVPETPFNLRPDRTLAVNEDQGVGGFAWMVADDPDGQSLNYAIVDGMDGGGRFTLRSDGLLVAQGGYNYEEVKGYTIRVRATDPIDLYTTRDFWVAINDVNERPKNLSIEAQNLFSETQNWESHAGQLIARFTMADTDAGPPPGLVIVSGNDHGWFGTVGGNHLAFTGKNFTTDWFHSTLSHYGQDGSYLYDSDGDGAYEIRVATLMLAAQDASGLRSDPFEYKVLIEDTNEAPSITTGGFSVPEHTLSAGNFVIATIGFKEWDPSPRFGNSTFAITSGNDGDMFSINATTGEVKLRGELNYEARSTYSLGITITDAGGLSNSRAIDVKVEDINEAPAPSARYVYTDSYNGTAYYFVSPNDADKNQSFTMSSNAGGAVTVTSLWNSSANGFDVWIKNRIPHGSAGTITATVKDQFGLSGSTNISYSFSQGQFTSPVIIDLDGDGVELIALESSTVYFDMDGDGQKDRTGWVAGDDGLLVLDKNKSGKIDLLSEISFAMDLEGAVSDLDGLRAYDSDGDGYFDKDDLEFSQFQIWQDRNQDGVSQAGELTSLAAREITSIRLELDETGEVVEGSTDNVLFATSEAYKRNGSTMDVGDVFLAYESSMSNEADGQVQGWAVEPALDGEMAEMTIMSADATVGVSSAKVPKKATIAFAGVDPTKPLHDKLKKATGRGVTPAEKAKNDEVQVGATALAGLPEEQAAPLRAIIKKQKDATMPKSPQNRSTVPDNSAFSAEAPAMVEDSKSKTPPDEAEASANAQQRDAVSDAQSPDRRLIALPEESGDDGWASVARTPARVRHTDPAMRAAEILRAARPTSFSAFNRKAWKSWRGGLRPVFSAGDVRVDQLIAAMAAFHDGGAVGAMQVEGQAPIDNLLAQLAPAV